jgi:hypothetical protein
MRSIRNNLTYANVMSTLAVFFVLAGGGAIAAVQLGKNTVKSKQIAPNAVKGVDAAEDTFAKVPSAQSADTAKNADTAASAQTAGTASTVAANAVGAEGIQNPTRSLSIPITSFVNMTDGTLLDFTASDGTSPDFDTSPVAIEWDDDTDAGGTNIADTDSVLSTYTIPADYASGAQYALRVAKDGHTGIAERVLCLNFIDGFQLGLGSAIFTTTDFFETTYLVTPPDTAHFQPGRTVGVSCHVDNGSGGSSANDIVHLLGIEFRYTATQ